MVPCRGGWTMGIGTNGVTVSVESGPKDLRAGVGIGVKLYREVFRDAEEG